MKSTCWIYGIVFVALIILKIFGLVSWWAVTAPIWFPLAVWITIGLSVTIVGYIGKKTKEKAEKDFKPSCENCLFGIAEKYTNGECLGKKNKAEIENGICSYYHKYNTKN